MFGKVVGVSSHSVMLSERYGVNCSDCYLGLDGLDEDYYLDPFPNLPLRTCKIVVPQMQPSLCRLQPCVKARQLGYLAVVAILQQLPLSLT